MKLSQILLLTGIFAFILYILHRKNKIMKEENETLVTENDLLLKAIEQQTRELEYKNSVIDVYESQVDIDEEIKKELSLLEAAYRESHSTLKIAEELASAKRIFQAQETSKTVAILTKIIENLLKEKYEHDPAFCSSSYGNNKTLHNFIQYAKSQGDLKEDDALIANFLRLNRNQEAHELNVSAQKEKISFCATIVFAIDLIKKLKSGVSPQIV